MKRCGVRGSRSAPLAQLVAACAVLGAGVAMVLTAGLGSDGYSTFVNGASRASGLSFAVVNTVVGVVLVLLAWARRVRPGTGTLVQPVVVGVAAQAVLEELTRPAGLLARAVLLAAGLAVLCAGVAGYLGAGAGAGPAEGAAYALRPLPFRRAYSLLQATGALAGWALGADVGLGTAAVVLAVGPLVDLLLARVPVLTALASARAGTAGAAGAARAAGAAGAPA